MWPLLAMAGMDLLGKGLQNQAAAKQAKSDNKAIRKANKENTLRTAFSVGMLNVQRGQNRARVQQQLADQGVSKRSQIGVATANQAASETVGASADAVLQDIQMQYSRERANIEQSFQTDEFNYNTELRNIVQAGQDAIRSPNNYKSPSLVSSLLGTAISVGGVYAQDKMRLGLGA